MPQTDIVDLIADLSDRRVTPTLTGTISFSVIHVTTPVGERAGVASLQEAVKEIIGKAVVDSRRVRSGRAHRQRTEQPMEGQLDQVDLSQSWCVVVPTSMA